MTLLVNSVLLKIYVKPKQLCGLKRAHLVVQPVSSEEPKQNKLLTASRNEMMKQEMNHKLLLLSSNSWSLFLTVFQYKNAFISNVYPSGWKTVLCIKPVTSLTSFGMFKKKVCGIYNLWHSQTNEMQ